MEREYPTYLPTRCRAPTMNYPVRPGGTPDGRVNNFPFPAYPVPQPAFANGPLHPMGNDSASAAAYSNTTTNLVDVDKIIRLKQLNNNVYLISRNDAGVNHRFSGTQSLSNEDCVQLGVVVNDTPTGLPVAAAVHVPQSREDKVPPSIQRLIFSLRTQVRNLQHHMAEVESEFQVRFYREKELSAKVRGLIERNNAAEKFKCDQATQVNIVKSTSQCEQGVQTYDSSSTTPDLASNPPVVSTDSLKVTKEQEPPINKELLLSDSLNGLLTSTPATETDETVDPFLVAITKRQPGWSRGCWPDPSSSEFEDKGDMKTYAERRSVSKFVSGDSTRQRKRSWISPSTNSTTSYDTSDSDYSQDFPSDHPFRHSRDILKPPKVPANYCTACYEKTRSRMRGKFCYACRARVGRLKKAYIASRDTQLPHCDHPMGDPKRKCGGCIFKVYTYRHNRRNPTNLLPFPREDQEDTPQF